MTSFSSVQADEALLQIRPPALGHREAHESASALVSGDVAGCFESFSSAPTWEDRWFCLEHIATRAPSGIAPAVAPAHELAPIEPSLIEAWVSGWPGHPVPLLVRAAIAAFAGGDPTADLHAVAAVEPDNPLVHGLHVVHRAATGVGDLEAPLAQMLAVDPLYEPHVRFLRSLGPNGDGDAETALAFARSVDDVVPAASPLRAMVPLAAIEVILAEQPEDHLGCLDAYGFRPLIMMAAGQSVFHPNFVGHPSIPGVKAMTAFLVALELMGEDDLALMLHHRMNGVFADWPLSLLGPPSMNAWTDLGRHMAQNAPAAASAGQRI